MDSLRNIYNRRKQAKIHFHIALLLTDSANFIFSQLLHHHALTSGCFIPASRQSCLKNAVLLIPSCGFRCIIPALLQLGFILILSSNLWLGLLFLFPGYSGNYLNNHHSSSLAKAAADSFERRIIPSSKTVTFPFMKSDRFSEYPISFFSKYPASSFPLKFPKQSNLFHRHKLPIPHRAAPHMPLSDPCQMLCTGLHPNVSCH